MAKKIRKLFAVLVAVAMCTSMIPQALAAEVTTEATTEISSEGLDTSVTTTTTTTTDESGNTTVTVTIEKSTDGTTEDGVNVKREENSSTTTTTNTNGNVIGQERFEDGTETKSWDEDVAVGQDVPDVEVSIVPGETTSGTATDSTSSVVEDDAYDYAKETTTTDREVSVEASDVDLNVSQNGIILESVGPDAGVGSDSVKVYGDTGTTIDPEYWTIDYAFYSPSKIPDGWTVQKNSKTNAVVTYTTEEGVVCTWTIDWVAGSDAVVTFSGNEDAVEFLNDKFLFTGYGNWTNKKVGYEIIKKDASQVSNKTNTAQFALRDESGNYHYTYCVDMDTDVSYYAWYTVDNLEEGTYYDSEDSVQHIRYIVKNGYWGSADNEDGTAASGSLNHIKNMMLNDENLDLTERIEISEGVTVEVQELIEGLTEVEALNVTQAAIWTYSNGSTREGDDKGAIVTGEFFNNLTADGISEARMQLLYKYLIAGVDTNEATKVVDDTMNFGDMSFVIGDKVGETVVTEENGTSTTNGVYDTSLNFTLAFIPGENDEMYVCLMDSNNQPIIGENGQPIRKLLTSENSEKTGDNIIKPINGVYTLPGLKLSENSNFEFVLRLEGTQYLEQGVYVYTACGDTTSQTMVGLAEGTHSVDVSATMTVSFTVDEKNHVVLERKWANEYDPIITEPTPPQETPEDPQTPPQNPPRNPAPPAGEEEIPEEDPPLAALSDDGEVILDEEVPLANVPKTGDSSIVWLFVSAAVVMAIVFVNLSNKKRTEA